MPHAAAWRVPALVIVVLVALAVRLLVVVLAQGGSIDMDGSEYVRVAQNIAAGNGPLGMRGTPDLVFPPLYPWLIAALLRLGVGSEVAALAIALLAGTAFAAALYALGATVYDRVTGVVAGLIGALLPICVDVSTTAVSEAPFAVAATVGLVLLVRVIRRWNVRDATLCGAAFGVAYLLRPEGALFAAAALLLAGAAAVIFRRRGAPVAALAVGALLLATPAFVASYAASGHVVLEGKSGINFRLAEGLRSGAGYLAVADAVDADGRPIGPEIDPRFYEPGARPPSVPAIERLKLALVAEVHHVRDVAGAFGSREYGGGLVIVLIIAGLIGRPWSRLRLRDEIVLAAYGATGFVALAGVWHFWPRYGALFLPVAIVWAAFGVVYLGYWSRRSRLPNLGLAALAVLLLGSLAVDVATARAVPPGIEREAGAWIAAQGRPGTVVDVSSRTAFYARALWRPLPYGDERAAARYLRSLRPTYVVLDSERGAQYPPLAGWFAHGLPRSLGVRVHTASDGRGRTLSVYRFTAR